MSAQTAAAAPYHVGQAVEVEVYDFKAPGMPEVWRAAHVVRVTREGKLFDVFVDVDGVTKALRVGVRRGNQRIRPA